MEMMWIGYRARTMWWWCLQDGRGGPYNEITSVKCLVDMVGQAGDKSGFF